MYVYVYVQLTAEFAQRLSSKISELLAVMENGLKTADQRDCTTYTGWAGNNTVTHKGACVTSRVPAAVT